MLCAVVKGPALVQVREQLAQARKKCDLVELRLDFFHELTLDQLKRLRSEFPIPMIFTLRPIAQGGAYDKTEAERLEQIRRLSTLNPEYIDLEYTVDKSFVDELKKQKHSATKIILSFHDFEKMPPLMPILNRLKQFNADLYKVAVMPHSASEALSLLTFMEDNQPNLLVMGMGPYGEVTRLLSPIYGGKYVYASLETGLSTAPGQATVDQLRSIFHYETLGSDTKVYGLIGDPVTKSIGYLTHNAVMHTFNLSAVYVNFHVAKEQLKEFIHWAKKARLAGLSVTMPLKEEILSSIDEVEPWAKNIGAVNTLLFSEGRVTGFNTDGKGAMDAIEEKVKVKGKKIIFIGAGGATRAIAKTALDREADVIILNRNAERAITLANQLGCRGGALELINEGYDIIVNATPSPLPIDPIYILPNTVAMDINTRPKLTSFLENAGKKRCTLVYGYEMFVNQAIGQFKIWFGDEISTEQIKGRILKVLGGVV